MYDITPTEADLLNTFRVRVSDALDSEYKRSDGYLIHWIRFKNHDLSKAEIALRETLEWRREQRIDTILEENIDLPKEFDFETSVTKDGRPVVIVPGLGRCDFRKEVEKGNREKLMRRVFQYIETGEVGLEKQFGANIAINQLVFLADFHGFAYRQLASPRTAGLFLELTQITERHWPLRINTLCFVNGPSVIKYLLALVKPFFSKTTIAGLRVYNSNRKEWQDVLKNRISPENLPTNFGGERIPMVEL